RDQGPSTTKRGSIGEKLSRPDSHISHDVTWTGVGEEKKKNEKSHPIKITYEAEGGSLWRPTKHINYDPGLRKSASTDIPNPR
ncbi:hypothetical protein, partial [Solihabitans fulvus]|uniref:hypothetical protein n=1 Tax=Solihabitans fulvus TaxID=1892852 RepID=UPI001CB76268